MKKVIVPYSPAHFCAIGEELADIRYDYVRTIVRSINNITTEEYNEIYEEMINEAIAHLSNEGFAETEIMFNGTSDSRYAGQAWELSVPVPIKLTSKESLQKIAQDFHDIHRRTYGYSFEDKDVALVNLRLSAVGKVKGMEYVEEPLGSNPSKISSKGSRNIFLDGSFIKCPIYQREKLTLGTSIAGPALIEEYASNTLIPAQKIACIDRFRDIVIATA
jgi:N-methylhydantoinase A